MSWEEVKISEVYKGLYDGPHATPTLCNDGPIFLSIANVSETGQLDLTNTKHISESEYPKWTKRITPRENDLVFTYEASLHRYAIIPRNFVGCLGRRLALVRPDNNKAYYKYLFYYFLSDSWRKEVGNYILTGTTVDRVPLTKFPQFKILLPDLKTQKKIAAILSAYDDLLENNKRRIALLENMAEEIYREWFVRFRFPGYQTTEFEKGIPKGWELNSIKHLSVNYDSKRIPLSGPQRNELPGNIPYYGAAKIMGYIGKSIFDGRYLLVAEDGSVITTDGYPVLQLTNGKFWVNNHAHILEGSNDISTEWLYLSLKRYPVQGLITGAAQPKITQGNLNKIFLYKPPMKIHEAFFEIIYPIFNEMENLDKSNILLEKTKSQLIPRLISGKLSVEDLDIQFPSSMQPTAEAE